MLRTIKERIKSNPILRSSISIGLIIFLAKILGYSEKVTLAYYFGTNYEVDVYNVIMSIVLSIFIFFREVIEPGFLNVFLKALNAKDEQGAWDLFNKFCRYILFVTLVLCVFVYGFAEAVINLFAPGFTAESNELSVKLIQFAFPSCVFLSLSALTNITLNGLKEFALPASGDLAFKGIILLCIFFLYQYWGIYAAIFGVFIGAGAKLLVHCMILFRKFSFGRREINPEYIGDVWKLTWPLLIGVTFSQISGLVDNIFASYLQEGAISALSYSKKIIELPILIFPYILSVVIFPYFSELAIAKNKEKLFQLFSQSLSWIIITFMPLSAFFFIFSHELVEVIFQRGAFDENSTILTAQPLVYYSVGMVFFAIETILVIFYFANANTKTPILVGILCVTMNIILTYILVSIMGYVGIAIALVISKAVKVGILLMLLKNYLIINHNATVIYLYKIFISCTLFIATIFIAKYMLEEVFYSGIIGKILFLGATFLLGALVYITSLFMIKLEKKSFYINS